MTTHKHDNITIIQGDCRDVLKDFKRSVTAVVTDPPYGISFMNSGWDHAVPGVDFWSVIQSVCLPGSYMLAFGGTRTYHRQTCAIEDAGWLIRDCLMWVYGSGFPKSHNISIALDKVAGADREIVGHWKPTGTARPNKDGSGHRGRASSSAYNYDPDDNVLIPITKPATPNAQTWDGWGTALKPALEPICLAQNPREGTFVDNVLKHGCGGLNVDGCRIEGGSRPAIDARGTLTPSLFGNMGGSKSIGTTDQGRFPSNLLIDDSPEVIAGFPESTDGVAGRRSKGTGIFGLGSHDHWGGYGQKSPESAARFFYCAKASRAEREAGCWDVPPMSRGIHNSHPTVKPIALMRYLLRLIIQPERNLILDPFAGSGTTGIACALAGVPCVLIEQDPHHVEIIKARIQWATDIRQRLGREPDLDLSPYQSKSEPTDDNQGSLF